MWGMLPTFFCSITCPRRGVKQELQDVVTKGLISTGFDLVEIKTGGTKSRLVVEVRIDRRDGSAVTVDDCVIASRAIEALLDGTTIVPENYELQVSSPGERPLRSPGDWRRQVGRWASILSPEYGGRFEAQIKEVGDDDILVVLDDRKKSERRIPLAAVKEARLAFHL
jgi:ribosome maturation factor RimP